MLLTAPIILTLLLASCVTTWQHGIIHETASQARTMHMPLIILYMSMATCSGILVFFVFLLTRSTYRICGMNQEQQGRYEFSKKWNGRKGSSPTDVLTISMVWSSVYGLGVSFFVLGYVYCMGSTLCTFSFLVGLIVASLLESLNWGIPGIEEEEDVDQGQAEKDKTRIAASCVCLFLSFIAMCLMGVHTVRHSTINMAGKITAADTFLAIIFPMFIPMLLRGTSGLHPTMSITGTLEISFPFTLIICTVYIASFLSSTPVLPLHMVRNTLTATLVMPLLLLFSILYTLTCVFRRRIIHMVAPYLVVASGRELTMYRDDAVVICMLFMSLVALGFTLMTTSSEVLEYTVPYMYPLQKEQRSSSSSSDTQMVIFSIAEEQEMGSC